MTTITQAQAPQRTSGVNPRATALTPTKLEDLKSSTRAIVQELESDWEQAQSKLPPNLRKNFNTQMIEFGVRIQNDENLQKLITGNHPAKNSVLLKAFSLAKAGLSLGQTGVSSDIWFMPNKSVGMICIPAAAAYDKLARNMYKVNAIRSVALTDETAGKIGTIKVGQPPQNVEIASNVEDQNQYTQAIAWCHVPEEVCGSKGGEWLTYFLGKGDIKAILNMLSREPNLYSTQREAWLQKSASKKLITSVLMRFTEPVIPDIKPILSVLDEDEEAIQPGFIKRSAPPVGPQPHKANAEEYCDTYIPEAVAEIGADADRQSVCKKIEEKFLENNHLLTDRAKQFLLGEKDPKGLVDAAIEKAKNTIEPEIADVMEESPTAEQMAEYDESAGN